MRWRCKSRSNAFLESLDLGRSAGGMDAFTVAYLSSCYRIYRSIFKRLQEVGLTRLTSEIDDLLSPSAPDAFFAAELTPI